jgi:hypothetical protein
MSAGDTIALVVAVLTGAGLIVAQFTYYHAVASRARVEMTVGQEIVLHYTHDFRLYVRADLAFLNKGAQPAALVQVSGRLYKQDGTIPEVHLQWRTFETTTNTPEHGWDSRSTETVYTLVIPGRQAGPASLTRRIRLIAPRHDQQADPPLLRGELRLELTALMDYGRSPTCARECSLKISPDHALALNTVCVEDEKARYEKRLFLLRQIPTDDGPVSDGSNRYVSQEPEKYFAL